MVGPGPAARAATALHFNSGGRDIQVDYYAPATESRKPPILVLNGAGGVIFDGPDMRRMARRLASGGYPAYLVHYFNRTGSLAVMDPMMRRHFDEWLSTVRDAVTWVRAQPLSQGRAVGIYGYSLGAFLSLAASSDNPGVGAVVEQAGGIWYGQRERLKRLPPVLMIHGRDDRRVPLEKFAVPLAALLKERAASVEARFYAGQGHSFQQPVEEKVRDLAVGFFDRNLRR